MERRYATYDFGFRTDEIGTGEIWTTYLVSPSLIILNLIHAKPKLNVV